jgi:hypothetical protein
LANSDSGTSFALGVAHVPITSSSPSTLIAPQAASSSDTAVSKTEARATTATATAATVTNAAARATAATGTAATTIGIFLFCLLVGRAGQYNAFLIAKKFIQLKNLVLFIFFFFFLLF